MSKSFSVSFYYYQSIYARLFIHLTKEIIQNDYIYVTYFVL